MYSIKKRVDRWFRVHWIFRLELTGIMALVATLVAIAFFEGYIDTVWFAYLFVVSIGLLTYLTNGDRV